MMVTKKNAYHVEVVLTTTTMRSTTAFVGVEVVGGAAAVAVGAGGAGAGVAGESGAEGPVGDGVKRCDGGCQGGS